jgi:hypothetical protein
MRGVFIMIPFLLLFSCTFSDCPKSGDIDTVPVTIQIERLEGALFETESPAEVGAFLDDYRSFADIFLDARQYPSDTILANRISILLENPSLDTLYNESVAAYSDADLDEIKRDLEMAVGKLKSLYPNTKTPRMQTAVTGLYKDLFISDSLIIVGLDFFIGKGATFTPKDIPAYVLSRYNKEHLASIVVKFFSGQQVANGRSETLLSEMIDFGKTYYLASRLLPCTPDSILLGYTPKNMELIYQNEPVIWANLLENEVLYETSHVIKRKFIGERPNVYEIDEECPGRIGAWVGWRIVEQYMKQNDVTIKELLADSDNDKIFRLSGYKPQSH